MGEARRRQKGDPNYGRPIRGLILGSAIPQEDGFTVASGIDPQGLRHALLFWDQLVWPDRAARAAQAGGLS
jgi:hypothetical protein